MKILKIVFVLSVVAILSMLFITTQQAINKLSSPIPTVPPVPTEIVPTKIPVNEIQFDGKTYQFHFHKILSTETLDLIPNFENATFSAQIVRNNNCSFGINGGFYKKEGGPLGLFQVGGKKFGVQIASTTFNGFLEKKSNVLSILYTYSAFIPNTSSDFVLQTGPLIFLKNQIQPNFLEEAYSRRNLIAKSVAGEFYLFSIFEKDNVFNGPRLKDLRGLFLSPEFMRIADFELILNLDGGSASAFYDTNVQVEEFKQIGSFLCGKTK